VNTKFPDFDKDIRRPFAVQEYCYDCAEFYHGCNAWPANKTFDCADYYPLPDVGIDGATGQAFPPSRMQGRKQPMVRGEIVPDGQENSPDPPAVPTRRQTAGSRAKSRRCACGAALSKGKQLCESCRAEARRRTMREYMQRRRAGWISELGKNLGPEILDTAAYAFCRNGAQSEQTVPTRLIRP
jgi:hypothetical protein